MTSVKEKQSCEKQTRWRANNSQLTVSFSLVTDFWKNLDFRIQNPKEFDFWPRISFELLKPSTNLKFENSQVSSFLKSTFLDNETHFTKKY